MSSCFFFEKAKKLNINESKKLAFLSQQFHYNNKISGVSSGTGGVGVVVSTDIEVDNVDYNVTELTHNLNSKSFSCISDLKGHILLLKNSLPQENAFLLHLS